MTPAGLGAKVNTGNEQQQKLAALQAKYMPTAEQTVVSDLNNGNYSGAWSTALGTSGLYGTNYNSQTTDPLLADMESSQGLEQLDPSKQWNQQSIDQYYQALGSNPVFNGKTTTGLGGTTESLGEDPSGLWGSGTGVTSGGDAATNIQDDGANAAPNVAQFAGARPKQNFIEKYGGDIATLAAAVAAPYAAPELAGALGLGTSTAALAGAGALYGAGTTAAIDAATGKPITLGGEALGALGGATGSGALKGLGSTVGSALGVGDTAGGAIVGAGTGALKGELSGQGALAGAVSGGIGGAIQGSGIVGTTNQALTNAGLPSGVAGAITGGVLGLGTGAIGSAVTGGNASTGAELGGLSGAITGGINGAMGGSSALGTGAGIIGGALLRKYLTSSNSSPAAASTPAASTTAATAASPAAAQPTPVTGAQAANIGAYSGYPQMQQQTQNINYSTYGQGPEAQFFTGEN